VRERQDNFISLRYAPGLHLKSQSSACGSEQDLVSCFPACTGFFSVKRHARKNGVTTVKIAVFLHIANLRSKTEFRNMYAARQQNWAKKAISARGLCMNLPQFSFRQNCVDGVPIFAKVC
jgi:hypothetical protein